MSDLTEAGISVEVSLNSSHVMPPGHHIRHVFDYVLLNQHKCLLMTLATSNHVCYYIAPVIMYVTIAHS